MNKPFDVGRLTDQQFVEGTLLYLSKRVREGQYGRNPRAVVVVYADGKLDVHVAGDGDGTTAHTILQHGAQRLMQLMGI